MKAQYTDAQIAEVCAKASDIMKDFTDVQNCTFPSTAIIQGMEDGLTAEEIGNNAYNAVCALPLRQTGFGLVGMGDTMHNIALYMQEEVVKQIKILDKAIADAATT